MHEPDVAPERRGRLHGRLLQLLGVVSAVAGLIALWQFGVFGDEPDRDAVGAIDGPETLAISGAADPTSSAAATPTASSTSASPSESTPAETSAAPSTEASSPASPASTTAAGAIEESAAAVACTANLELSQEWDDMVEVSVEVINTGSEATESWEIDLDLDDAEITNYWGMRHLEGDRFESEHWNGQLDPDENTVTGFQAEVGRNFDLPDSVACTALF
jgi:hypothetical protein